MSVKERKRLQKENGDSGLKAYDLFSEMYDEDTEDLTGDIKFNVSMKASGVSKKTGKPWKRKPDVYDAKAKPIKSPPEFGSGDRSRPACLG